MLCQLSCLHAVCILSSSVEKSLRTSNGHCHSPTSGSCASWIKVVINSRGYKMKSLHAISCVPVGRRAAFSMIEMTIAASILAIGSAVIVPRWGQSVERAKLTSMRRCVESDIELLRRLSVRRGQQFNLTFAANSGEMTIDPAIPDVLGNAVGVVNFANRFPGTRFSAIDLNGHTTCKINHYGEIVSVYTGQSLTAGLLTIATDSMSQTSDLMLAQGLVSTPTQPGEEETPPATESRTSSSAAADSPTSEASLAQTVETTTETKTKSSSKSVWETFFGK